MGSISKLQIANLANETMGLSASIQGIFAKDEMLPINAAWAVMSIALVL